MADFHAGPSAAAAQAAFEQAAAAVENFQKLDSRVRDFVVGGNALLAGDLIFSDGLEATGTASSQVEAALYEELQARQAGAAGLGTRQVAILGGAAAGILLLVVMLGFTGATPKSEPAPVGLNHLSSRPAIEPDKPSSRPAAPKLPQKRLELPYCLRSSWPPTPFLMLLGRVRSVSVSHHGL